MRILTALIVLCIWSWPSPAFSAPEPLQIRPGLMQALQHRATFTRAHRGPFANQLDGNLVESTDYAQREYGATPKQIAGFEEATEKRYRRLKRSSKLVTVTTEHLRKMLE